MKRQVRQSETTAFLEGVGDLVTGLINTGLRSVAALITSGTEATQKMAVVILISFQKSRQHLCYSEKVTNFFFFYSGRWNGGSTIIVERISFIYASSRDVQSLL